MSLPAPYYSRDGITLYHGDCLDILPQLPAGSVDAVVTDPPYSSGTRREGSKGLRKSMNRTTGDDDWFGSDCMTTTGFIWTMRVVATQAKRLLCRGGHLLTFIDWRMSASLAAAIESADLRHLGLLVWDKVGFGMGAYFRNQHELILHFSHGRTRPVFRRDMPNVLRHSRFMDSDHDTQKPVELLVDLITVVADRGEIILDPFIGSGTTAVACIKTGRKCIGIEISEQYCAIAARRCEEAFDSQALFRQEEASA